MKITKNKIIVWEDEEQTEVVASKMTLGSLYEKLRSGGELQRD